MDQREPWLGLDTSLEDVMVLGNELLEVLGTGVSLYSWRLCKKRVIRDGFDSEFRTELIPINTLGEFLLGDRFFGEVELGFRQSALSAKVVFNADVHGVI